MSSAKELVEVAIKARNDRVSAEAAVRAVRKARDPELALQLAVEVPRADRKALEAVIIAAKPPNPRVAYMWAVAIPGADLTALAPIVGRSPFYATEFERHFGSIDAPKAATYGVHIGNAHHYRPAEVLEILPGDRKVLVRFADRSRAWIPTERVARLAVFRSAGYQEV